DLARRRTSINSPIEAHISRTPNPDGTPGPAPKAVLDKDMVMNALAEVLANALQASNGGSITVRTHTTGAERRLVFVVEDKGAGMSPRALQHAFDPFF